MGTLGLMPPEGPWAHCQMHGMLLVTCRGGGMSHGSSLQPLPQHKQGLGVKLHALWWLLQQRTTQ